MEFYSVRGLSIERGLPVRVSTNLPPHVLVGEEGRGRKATRWQLPAGSVVDGDRLVSIHDGNEGVIALVDAKTDYAARKSSRVTLVAGTVEVLAYGVAADGDAGRLGEHDRVLVHATGIAVLKMRSARGRVFYVVLDGREGRVFTFSADEFPLVRDEWVRMAGPAVLSGVEGLKIDPDAVRASEADSNPTATATATAEPETTTAPDAEPDWVSAFASFCAAAQKEADASASAKIRQFRFGGEADFRELIAWKGVDDVARHRFVEAARAVAAAAGDINMLVRAWEALPAPARAAGKTVGFWFAPRPPAPQSPAGGRVVNLTPHAVTVVADGGSATIPPSGGVARVATTRELVGTIIVDGVEIPVYETSFGAVEGLPAPQQGVLYVVSGLVLAALKSERSDLLAPGELIRDGEGRVVGCRGFTR